MSHLVMIILMAVITFATRISFLLRPLPSARIRESRFLHVFPVALRCAGSRRPACSGRSAGGFTSSLAAGVGGIIGAVLFKRSILGIIATGLVGYWIARLLV